MSFDSSEVSFLLYVENILFPRGDLRIATEESDWLLAVGCWLVLLVPLGTLVPLETRLLTSNF